MRNVVWMAALLVGCGHAPAERKEPVAPPAPVEVETVRAEAAEFTEVRSYLGSFVADQASRLAADANGVVRSVHVERGQAVRKGDVLVEVDGVTARLSAEASAAQLALAAAQKEVAAADCVRFQRLYEEGAISAAQLERSLAQCEAQARSVDAATASLRIAETQAARTRVRAPFDGIVDEKLVDPGEFVTSASPVISLVSIDPVRVRFSVPERDLPAVAGASEVRVRADAVPGRVFTGTLLPLPPAAREQSRDMVFEAIVPNPDGAARPGLTARVEVVGATSEVVAVPPEAVRKDDSVHRVYVVKDGSAVENVVHVERLPDGRYAVSPGVAVGDEVVLRPPPSLRDGSPVR